MASFSFKTLLKVISVAELQALALNSSNVEDLCTKLNLNPAQVRYLYKKAGIELSFFKNKRLVPNPEQIYTKEDLVKYIGKPLHEVSLELNLKPKKVINLFSQHDLPVPIRSNNFAIKCPISKQELEYEYLTLNKTTTKLGEKYQVSKQQICNWLSFYKIPVKPKGFTKGNPSRNFRKHKLWSWSNEEFLNKVKSYESAKDFCRKEKISFALFNTFIKERNLETPFPKQKFEFTKEYIVDLYLVKNMTIKQIAKQEGCHWQTINRCLKKYGLTNSRLQ
jgi:hypothetical protein